MEVEVDVNENDIVKIKLGDSADVEVDAYTKKKFKGMVTSISNSASTAATADQVTNFRVKVRILKSSYADFLEGKPANYSPFRPGMTATVDIITKKRANVLAVPISAVVVKSDTTAAKKDFKVEDQTSPTNTKEKKFECVFVEKGGIARLRAIKTGIQDESNIEIISGLNSGENVITGPYSTVSKDLNPGDKVVKKSDKPAEKAAKE
jgi:HlyD family secretion protein